MSNWISVKERLPEYEAHAGSDQFCNVIVSVGTGLVTCGMYCNEHWEAFGILDAPVTHWMPLPKPPTEK